MYVRTSCDFFQMTIRENLQVLQFQRNKANTQTFTLAIYSRSCRAVERSAPSTKIDNILK